LYVRWINTTNVSTANGTVAGGGTSRIDNIYIKGSQAQFVSGLNGATISGNSYTATGLNQNTTYYYYVTANTNAGIVTNSSNQIEVTTTLPCTLGLSTNVETSICEGDNLNLVANTTGGYGQIGYSWSSANGYSSTEESPLISNASISNAGLYIITATDSLGCTATDSLLVLVNQPSTSNSTETACGAFNWNGTTYTNTGVYTFVTSNSVGCDSTATLNLTINNS
jgi:hypothetical protein